MAICRLSTLEEVIIALGGAEAVCRLTGRSVRYALQNRSNWRFAGTFPPHTCAVMTEALRKRGFEAPIHLWNRPRKSNAPRVREHHATSP